MHKTLIVILSAGIILGACDASRHTFRLSPQSGVVGKQASSHFVLFGLGQSRTIDAAKICGGAEKVAGVETAISPANGFLGNLTLYLYAPQTYRVSCTR